MTRFTSGEPAGHSGRDRWLHAGGAKPYLEVPRRQARERCPLGQAPLEAAGALLGQRLDRRVHRRFGHRPPGGQLAAGNADEIFNAVLRMIHQGKAATDTAVVGSRA